MALTIRRTTDFYPKEDGKYFTTAETSDCLAVIIPFFNEEANELKQTLNSLYYGFRYLCKRRPVWKERGMKIIIMQDGWYKASESMKEYLRDMYNEEDWSQNIKEFTEYNVETDGPVSYVFEKNKKIVFNQKQVDNNEEHKKSLNITMLIKIDNRKKHNSHEWFLGRNGFGEETRSKYLFCTDAFTMFNKSCMYHLINHLDNNEDVSVATGRQRVMTKEQQGTDEHFFSLSTILRNVQLFDFESSNALYNGAFSIGGYLPVIPGPCGVYRSRDILVDSVRYWYFDIVNQEPAQTGLILGNLRIAEDRILSYSVVLKTEAERRMSFVPMSVFYFEAELDLERLVLQRRRWINGSVAGYFYLLMTNPEHLLQWKTNIFRKAYTSFLLMCQFLTYCIVSVSPALSLNIFLFSITYVLSFTTMNYITNETISYLSTGFFCFIYIMNMFIHHEKKYDTRIMITLVIFSFLTAVLTFMSFVLFYLSEINGNPITYIQEENSVILYLFLSVLFLPFINSILISGKFHSFFYMIKSFPSYFLFSHMLISGFGSYSYSRIHDLSWGNRPTSELTSNITREELELSQKNFKDNSKKCIYIIVLLNILTFFSPKPVRYGVVGLFLGISIIQMIFSFFFFIAFIPNKIKYVYDRYQYNISQIDLVRDREIEETPTETPTDTIVEQTEPEPELESVVLDIEEDFTDTDISISKLIEMVKERKHSLNPFADPDIENYIGSDTEEI